MGVKIKFPGGGMLEHKMELLDEKRVYYETDEIVKAIVQARGMCE